MALAPSTIAQVLEEGPGDPLFSLFSLYAVHVGNFPSKQSKRRGLRPVSCPVYSASNELGRRGKDGTLSPGKALPLLKPPALRRPTRSLLQEPPNPRPRRAERRPAGRRGDAARTPAGAPGAARGPRRGAEARERARARTWAQVCGRGARTLRMLSKMVSRN